MCLVSVELFYGCEVYQVLVVSIDGDLVSYSDKVDSLFLKCFNHYYKFFIVDRVVKFSSLELL